MEFRASRFEYRFRYGIHLVLFVLGFTAPWDYAVHLDPAGPNAHVWGMLAAQMARMGAGNIPVAFNVLVAVAIGLAFLAAWLRTWGAAYLGANVVQSRGMHTAEAAPATGMQQDGPFRHTRNPLYLGTFLHTLALALLMPPSGAVFTIVTIGVLQVRLMLAEEPFLLAKLGAPYAAYSKLVPRVWPSLRPRVVGTGLKPRWVQAVAGEIYMWGVACSFAFAGWRYNAELLERCVIVCVGISLVMRAIAPPAKG